MERETVDIDALAAIIRTQSPAPLREKMCNFADLEKQLLEAWQVARSIWPQLSLDAEAFVTHLAARLPAAGEPEAVFEHLRADELYLACACASGCPEAIAAFESTVLPDIDVALHRLNASGTFGEEVKQVVRVKLLVGDDAKIATYAGRGTLSNWVRMVAVRTVHNLRRRTRREVLTSDEFLVEQILPLEAPDLMHLKRLYRAEFRQAVHDGVRALSSKERILLKQAFVDGLSSEGLAALYKVHRATASRWLVAAQQALGKATRAALSESLSVDNDELDSILRLIQSRLDASIHRLLDEVK